MHTFMTGFKIDDIENGYRLTIHSPMGDYIFDAHKVIADSLATALIENIYNLDSFDDPQIELF